MDVNPEHAILWLAWRLAGRPGSGPTYDALPRLPTFEELSGVDAATGPSPHDGAPPSPGSAVRSGVGSPAPGAVHEAKPAEIDPKPSRTRARQRPGRQRIRPADHPLLVQLGHTGVATEQHALAAGISRRRLGQLLRAGVLREAHTMVSASGALTPVRVLRLAPRGRNFVRRRLGLNLYSHNARQVGHDLRLTEIYWGLDPAVRASWRSEGALIAQWKREGTYQRGCAVDAAVEIDGALVGIEVAVGYSHDEQTQKQRAIDRHFGGRGVLIT